MSGEMGVFVMDCIENHDENLVELELAVLWGLFCVRMCTVSSFRGFWVFRSEK